LRWSSTRLQCFKDTDGSFLLAQIRTPGLRAPS
jgi:hypothetical protein